MDMIKVIYTAVDGHRTIRTYGTLAGARKFAHKMIGEHPEMGRDYAVSFDGVGTIRVHTGCNLADLFPTKKNDKPTTSYEEREY
jgi:hypothetical protein